MTIEQAKKIYETDNKEYDLKSNEQFLSWYEGEKEYISYSVEELQEFINNITFWYETKYPNFYFERRDGIVNTRYENIGNICENMGFNRLLPRINSYILKNKYIGNGGFSRPIYGINNEIVGFKERVGIDVYYKNMDNDYGWVDHETITLDPNTGIVDSISLEDLGIDPDNGMNLEELERILKESHSDTYDFKEITKSLNKHEEGKTLRSVVLKLLIKKLLYSKNTNPRYGYERAKKLVKEFNLEFPELNLDLQEVEELIINALNEREFFMNKVLQFKKA